MSYQEVRKRIETSGFTKSELALFDEAYKFAATAHEGQLRKSGEPYVSHSLAVANYLATVLKLDMTSVVAGLLHDVPEDTEKTLDDIKKEFGEDVRFLVSGITKLGKIKLRNQKDEQYIETLRRMFLAMAKDIRVVLIKLADRRHNLKTLEHLPRAKQKRITRETLEVYVPIANRLGMWELKGELEDLCFPFIDPKAYTKLKAQVTERYEEMKEYVRSAKKEIREYFERESAPFVDINGRAKRLYSLYLKLQRPKYQGNINKIYDLVALRIITNTVADCYAVLGILHAHYVPLPGRIKDYIAFPKPNGYRSIHTTVFGPGKRILEIQIRTKEMHQEAEYGIAAHWAYSEKGKPESGANASHEKLSWVQQLQDWQNELGRDNKEFYESLRIDFFKNRIFVFTPKGEVKDLPESATALDFAFMVHTDLGLAAQGAKVNDKMGKLSDELHNGDVVEILKSKGPRVSRDWLRFVKTHGAKSKIKNYLNKHDKGWLTGIVPGFLKRK